MPIYLYNTDPLVVNGVKYAFPDSASPPSTGHVLSVDSVDGNGNPTFSWGGTGATGGGIWLTDAPVPPNNTKGFAIGYLSAYNLTYMLSGKIASGVISTLPLSLYVSTVTLFSSGAEPPTFASLTCGDIVCGDLACGNISANLPDTNPGPGLLYYDPADGYTVKAGHT